MKLLTFILAAFTLASPDGNISVEINSDKDALSYSVSAFGKDLIKDSPISVTMADGSVFGPSKSKPKAKAVSVDNVITPVVYKKSEISDRYNGLTLDFKGWKLEFRAYDDGVAYRFIGASKTPLTVASEQASFNFAGDWEAWVPYVKKRTKSLDEQLWNSFENTYTRTPISGWDKSKLAFMPVMVDAGDVKMCISESDLLGYPGMFLYNGEGGSCLTGYFARYPKEEKQGGHNMLEGLIESREDFIAKVDGKKAFPWRVIGIAQQETSFAQSDLVWKLASADDGRDWSWIKPGKVAWDWWNAWNIRGVDFESGINNRTYQYYIDFAAEHGIEYVILDEGWAVNKQADLMQVVPEINLPFLCKYAEMRGVGLVLWAGYWAFNRDMEGICRHYSGMGVKGWKIDFMDRDDQPMVEFYEKAARTAAEYGMFVDFHGAFKPAGLTRTWPNVLNFEGVAGLEQLKWSTREHDQVTYDVTIPFIRMFAGPMDYTQGAMRNATRSNYHPVHSEPMSQGTRCRQLAEYVVFDAPFTMLCDSPSNYLDEPECTGFISSIPTEWDETVAVDGKTGEYIVMARRSGNVWYIGAMTDWSARDFEIDLSFLPEGSYMMTAFRDGVNAGKCASDYAVSMDSVDTGATIIFHMAPGGGWVARLESNN